MENVWQWVFGTGAAAVMTAIGYALRRVAHVERYVQELRRELREERVRESTTLWARLEDQAAEIRAFKETVFREYPTKKDLSAMEDRLIEAIRHRPPVE